MNEKRRLGSCLFMDIVRDGIAPFEEPDRPQPLTPAQVPQETKDDFENWFETALQLIEGAKFHIEKEHLNLIACSWCARSTARRPTI